MINFIIIGPEEQPEPQSEVGIDDLIEAYIDEKLAEIGQPVCCFQVRDHMQNDPHFALLKHAIEQELLDTLVTEIMSNLPPNMVACNIDAH